MIRRVTIDILEKVLKRPHVIKQLSYLKRGIGTDTGDNVWAEVEMLVFILKGKSNEEI